MDMKQTTRTFQIHAQEKMLDTRRRPHKEKQWGDMKTTSHTYGIKDEREAGEIIKYKVH